MSDALIQTEGLGKTYRDGRNEVEVLRNIDFSMQAGERIAIIGASGSGKSTLLNCLGGIDDINEGRVLIEGRDIHAISENERCQLRNRELGFIYQFHHLLPEFTALENVAMPLLIDGVDVQQASDKARSILEEVGLANRTEHKPGELSGGERQRAAIARALIHEPKCILADEPTGNLDRHNAGQVMQIVAALNQTHNTSLVIVTHDMHVAQQMDRVMTLDDGQLAQPEE